MKLPKILKPWHATAANLDDARQVTSGEQYPAAF
jgi:hypothetical protein